MGKSKSSSHASDTPEGFEQVIHPRDAAMIAKFEDKLERRIDAGVKYLDKRFGRTKWLARVNESVLKLSDSRVCVTGQLFGDFTEEYLEVEPGQTKAVAMKQGFLLKDEEQELYLEHSVKKDGEYVEKTYMDGYNILTNLWYCRIRALRKIRRVKYTGK